MARQGRKVPTYQLQPEIIRERLNALGLASTKASEQAGMNRTWVQSILDGRASDSAGSAVIELARVLKCDVNYLYGRQSVAIAASSSTATPLPTDLVRQAMVVGQVQAGAWLEVDEFFEPTEFVTIDVPEGFGNARFPVFDVAGDSMDKGGILHGDRIVCWDIHDYPFPLREGDDVVVERRRAEGMLREWTVKRIFYHSDGTKELRPISNNPAHKSFRILPGDDGPENVIQIIAVVDRIIRPHRRRIGA